MTDNRTTGRDVILAVAENMRQSLEPLVAETVAPSLYQVYLHEYDYDHLRTLFPEIEREAQRFLDIELNRLNRSPVLRRLLGRTGKKMPRRVVSAEGRWSVFFQEDPNGALEPGDVEIVSDFAYPPPENPNEAPPQTDEV